LDSGANPTITPFTTTSFRRCSGLVCFKSKTLIWATCRVLAGIANHDPGVPGAKMTPRGEDPLFPFPVLLKSKVELSLVCRSERGHLLLGVNIQ
jgi:hypothetical protein